jgi:hypothetical protein
LQWWRALPERGGRESFFRRFSLRIFDTRKFGSAFGNVSGLIREICGKEIVLFECVMYL